MKNHENYPVNEWNNDATRLGNETVWPWDVVIPRPSRTRDTLEDSLDEVTVMTQAESDYSQVLEREPQHDPIATA